VHIVVYDCSTQWHATVWLLFPLITIYDTIRYDSVYLTCSKKLPGSQLSIPHGINKKIKCETKTEMMSVIGPVQSRYHDGRPIGKRSLRWKGFVEKVGLSFEWKSDEVMDVESRDNERDGLTSGWGGESRQDSQLRDRFREAVNNIFCSETLMPLISRTCFI